MPNKTTNYNLVKPLGNENYNVEDQNGNMDIIDIKLKENEDKISILNGTGEVKEKLNRSDFDSFKTSAETQMAEIKTQNTDFLNRGMGKVATGLPANYDLNMLKDSGTYMGSGMTNAPSSAWYMIEVIKHNDLYIYQRAIGFTENEQGTGRPPVYERTCRGGNWGTWSNLFQFANDGKTGIANAVTAKGVSASPTDTFATLASKIGQINTGKKWATGTLRLPDRGGTFNIVDLAFMPSMVVGYIYQYGSGIGERAILLAVKSADIYASGGNLNQVAYYNGTTCIWNGIAQFGSNYVNGLFKPGEYNYLRWYAFE